MDRRQFLDRWSNSSSSKSTTATAAPKRRTTTGVSAYTGTWGKPQILHLLRRTLFGVSLADISTYESLSMEQAVEKLLDIGTQVPNPPVNNYNTATVQDAYVAAGQPWVDAALDPNTNFLRIFSFKSWWTGEMINQASNIREKMVLFWHNHLATETEVMGDARLAYHQNKLIRAHCLGNFRDLIKAITIDPGMLVYLNGYLNTKNAPDENYARELQELFTLGKGSGSQYTEDDVKAAARVLTGWRINRIGNQPYAIFDKNRHDSADKVFSSFYSNTVITGRATETAGEEELNDLLSMIFAQQEVAKFICRKLYKFFVYYDITAEVETDVIEPLANEFRNSGYDIKAVLRKLLKSEHFFDPLNMGCVIKSPLDHIVGFYRQYGVVFPTSSNLEQQYNMWNFSRFFSEILGQDPGDPPSVAGWPAWYQAPNFHEMWINSDSLPKRNQFSDYLIWAGYTNRGTTIIADPVELCKNFSNPGSAEALLDEAFEYLLPLTPAASDRAVFKAILLPGGIPDYNWQNEWTSYLANPTDTTLKNNVYSKLRLLFKSIMNLAEYQLS